MGVDVHASAFNLLRTRPGFSVAHYQVTQPAYNGATLIWY